MPNIPPLRSRSQQLALGLYCLLVAAWTYALEMPVTARMVEVVGDEWHFSVAKGLHLSIFAAEMALALYWPATAYGRRWAVAILSAQAVLTELFQYLLKDYFHRTGRVADVLIDHAGLATGLAAYALGQYAVRGRVNLGLYKRAGEKHSAPGPV